ncbi:MAG: magnesium transporter CorA family protein [Kiritimatiellae bacterium]|nr:magnesium transporter CorA family protein [Kiritimatiellia bacterium]
MIRSFIFKNGKLISRDVGPDLLRLFLYDDDVQMWVDLSEPTAEESKQTLETVFSFHPLALEDCLTISERPKVDEYENCIFLVLHAVDYSSHEFQTNELNLFIGRNFLVTYHAEPIRSVEALVERIHRSSTAIARAPDRLAYTMIDLLLENYMPALEDLSKDFSELERDALTDIPTDDFLKRVVGLKAEVARLHQIVGPQRETLARIAHGEFRIVRAHLLPYFRDLTNNLAGIADRANAYRDTLNSVVNIHLSIQQGRVNHVIKVLTVMATLTLPIVAVASYYGMNFKLPEMERFTGTDSHLYVWSVTMVITLILAGYLRLKKWL